MQRNTAVPSAPYLFALQLKGEAGDYTDELPALRDVERVEVHPRVTFLVGENGSGKSTLVEALAVALKLNPEGGTRLQQFAFATRSSHSQLHRRVQLGRAPLPAGNAFFIRAEGRRWRHGMPSSFARRACSPGRRRSSRLRNRTARGRTSSNGRCTNSPT